MSKRIPHFVGICTVVALLAMASSAARADWLETFGGNAFDQVWDWGCYPDVTKTFTHVPADGPGDNDYLTMDETTMFRDEEPYSFGSAFGVGFVTGQTFGDVRVGTVVNVAGDAASFYHGMGARAVSVPSPSFPPGILASAYIMHINWEGWPPEFRIDIEKVIYNYNMMVQDFDVEVPGLGNGGSFYAALDVIGTDPTYVTGYLYECEGGPLVAKTSTLIDTAALDLWEREAGGGRPPHNGPFLNGYSGVFAQNERTNPVGYHTTFDDVSSASQGARGPAAVYLTPADGATDVDVAVVLEWAEAASTTGRELWFGKEGAMRSYSPAGTTYDPGTLEFGQKYQWRVDQTSPGGTSPGVVATFTTEGTAEGCLLVDDFESYIDYFDIQAVWPDDIEGYEYAWLETINVYEGKQAMRFECQNQFEPYYTRLVHTFAEPQDWSKGGLAVLSLYFRGQGDNFEQPLFIELEDATGPTSAAKVDNPYSYASLTESWQKWSIELSEFSVGGLDLSQVTKISIGMGDGEDSGQPLGPPPDTDFLYIDKIMVCPLRCTLNSNADVDGNCKIDFGDFSAIAGEWLNEGTYVLP